MLYCPLEGICPLDCSLLVIVFFDDGMEISTTLGDKIVLTLGEELGTIESFTEGTTDG
jgi:hypothetical protein